MDLPRALARPREIEQQAAIGDLDRIGWDTVLLEAGLATALLLLGLAEVWVPLSSRGGAGDPRWSTA